MSLLVHPRAGMPQQAMLGEGMGRQWELMMRLERMQRALNARLRLSFFLDASECQKAIN